MLSPSSRSAAAASCCMRMPTVRVLSWKIFWTSLDRSPPPGVDAVEPLGVAARVVVDLEIRCCRRLRLWLTVPTWTEPRVGLMASRFLPGSSKQWSQRRYLPERSVLRLLPAVDAILGAGPAPRASRRSRWSGRARRRWLCGVSATTIWCVPSACVKK